MTKKKAEERDGKLVWTLKRGLASDDVQIFRWPDGSLCVYNLEHRILPRRTAAQVAAALTRLSASAPKAKKTKEPTACRPDEDVCLAHEEPLTCKHGCERQGPHDCTKTSWTPPVRWQPLDEKAASAMTDGQIVDVLKSVEAKWDEFRASLEGGAGSPGEWMVERMDELRTEQRRRALVDRRSKNARRSKEEAR